jgi:dipeptidase
MNELPVRLLAEPDPSADPGTLTYAEAHPRHSSVAGILALLLALSAAVFVSRPAAACTNLLVTPGASTDGSTFVTYVADSHQLYGALSFIPAADHAPGAMRDVFDVDSGDHVGQIEEVPHTFAVVGGMNEHQVIVGETTFGGREELVDPTGGLDYGSLMELALQRAANAREALDVMTSLADHYGYRSEGESFSVADPKEAWILEMVGGGPGSRHALWAAQRIPDGFISAHANQSRIRTFSQNDPKNARFAPGMVAFAREKGWFTGPDAQFSFADTFQPITFGGLRFCEARVWSLFRRAAPSLGLSPDLVRGDKAGARMPLWVRPDHRLSLPEVFGLMRDHFEGTDFDLSKGVGAGPYACPYRWRPLTWKAGGQEYLNERAISTQQTGYSFVAQARAGLPDPIGGVLWFGVDDTYSTVYVPLYCGLQETPPAFVRGGADLSRFSWDSMFWTFNFVSNLTYGRYSEMIVDVRKVQAELEGRFFAAQSGIEGNARVLWAQSPTQARDYLTRYSLAQAGAVHDRWRKLGEELLVKYLDGNLKDEHGNVGHPGYPQTWLDTVAAADGAHLRSGRQPGEPEPVTTVPVAGYFHSAAELGALGKELPASFDWTGKKLVLLESADRCKRPPLCCIVPKDDGKRLVLQVPEPAADACGARDWLIELPIGETREIVKRSAEH